MRPLLRPLLRPLRARTYHASVAATGASFPRQPPVPQWYSVRSAQLQAHFDAITLVGARAIYLCVGENNDLNVAPYTTDADLALDPKTPGAENCGIRKAEAQREDAKDTLNLFRILCAFPTVELAERITSLRDTPFSQAEAQQALAYLNELFLDETAHGAQLVGDAVGVLANRDEMTLSSVVLAHDLLTAIGE